MSATPAMSSAAPSVRHATGSVSPRAASSTRRASFARAPAWPVPPPAPPRANSPAETTYATVRPFFSIATGARIAASSTCPKRFLACVAVKRLSAIMPILAN